MKRGTAFDTHSFLHEECEAGRAGEDGPDLHLPVLSEGVLENCASAVTSLRHLGRLFYKRY